MLRKGHILAISVVTVSLVTILSIEAAQDFSIPPWVKNNALWWGQGDISDSDFISAINYLIEQDIVNVSSSDDQEQLDTSNKLRVKINALEAENQRLQDEIDELHELFVYDSNQNSGSGSSDYYEPEPSAEDYCFGNAACFFGIVTEIVDGDTIEVDGQSIRFALVDTPEYGEYGYTEARSFIESVCPVGSPVLVDQDDGQTQGSYNRMIAVIYCNDTSFNLNEAVLDAGLAEIDTRFCRDSEFGFHYWALIYGCEYEEPEPPQAQPPDPELVQEPSCDPSYPDVCIAPYPPDLDCGEIPYKNFSVIGSDPHRFDGDGDGIGCES